MEFLINNKIVYVKGYVNGAIYNFNNGKVYRVNSTGSEIIESFIKKQSSISNNDYLKELENLGLISNSFAPTPYKIKEEREFKLEMAWLELTESCNLRCVHCYEGDTHIKLENPLSLKDWKNLIDQLIELNVQRIILIGGEPCCCRFAQEIVEYCGTNKLNTTFFTNATLISDELINAFAKYNIKVKISIYGGNSDVHDNITLIPGSFALMKSNIQKMKRKNIHMSASVILMKENQNELNNIISFLKENGVTYSGYDVIRNVFGGNQNKHTPDNSKVISAKYREKPDFFASERRFVANHFYNSCWYGKIAIQENGNVLPCVFQRDIVLGNTKQLSIKEILQTEACKKYWELPFDLIDDCCVCEYRYACKDCRVIGLAIKNNLFEKNPRCLYDPKKGEWKELIKEK